MVLRFREHFTVVSSLSWGLCAWSDAGIARYKGDGHTQYTVLQLPSVGIGQLSQCCVRGEI